MAERLLEATDWLRGEPATRGLSIGYFGASTGAASALHAAALLTDKISAVVSRGGRPDLAKNILPEVKAATLLIVGSMDIPVVQLNQLAYDILICKKNMQIVQGATHLFEEPGKLEEVAELAVNWFTANLFHHEPIKKEKEFH